MALGAAPGSARPCRGEFQHQEPLLSQAVLPPQLSSAAAGRGGKVHFEQGEGEKCILNRVMRGQAAAAVQAALCAGHGHSERALRRFLLQHAFNPFSLLTAE